MPGVSAIGKLDERITFQRQVTTTNAHNEDEVTSWENVCTVYAEFKDEDAAVNKENFIADQITAERTAKAIIWHRTDLDEKMRILRRGRYYKIVSINYPDRMKSTVVKCILLDEV